MGFWCWRLKNRAHQILTGEAMGLYKGQGELEQACLRHSSESKDNAVKADKITLNPISCRLHKIHNIPLSLILTQSGQDPAICCSMSDPKLPNFGTYGRRFFSRFCTHSDRTYPFRPISVRNTDRTCTGSRYVRIEDRTCNLGQNVHIKQKYSKKTQ